MTNYELVSIQQSCTSRVKVELEQFDLKTDIVYTSGFEPMIGVSCVTLGLKNGFSFVQIDGRAKWSVRKNLGDGEQRG